jgi:hypothetical protein
VVKRVPNAGEVFYIYDKLDRVIMSQDEKQRSQNQIAFTKYDSFGRVIMTGLVNDAGFPWQDEADNATAVFETPDNGGLHYYSNNAVPMLDNEEQAFLINY